MNNQEKDKERDWAFKAAQPPQTHPLARPNEAGSGTSAQSAVVFGTGRHTVAIEVPGLKYHRGPGATRPCLEPFFS
eukprot:CAMPEP_0170173428 /NCGR_PEP_ID=MMETSP0040_2-20121228/6727_1 /TAXON_ID=641309 /ORGANISM="Lotharella oceanica, Strain CCMP622" /LENGTH=75 /DNA_ID=CAMNT_0010414613 /DNA_START=485 /DNA_END=708 /DNA_ORIENTATION=+